MAAIDEERLRDILASIISRLDTIESSVETEVQRETGVFEVVDNLAQIQNPVQNSVVLNRADMTFYVYDSGQGWVAV